MHVLMFLASTGRGGAEALVTNLCNQLVTTHQVTVLLFEHSEWSSGLNTGVSICYIGKKISRRNPYLYYRILKAIIKIKPDLVHVHGAKAASVFKHLEKLLPVPCVATKHNSRKGNVFNVMKNVVAVSGEVAATINHEVAVIYNGIDASEKILPELSKNIFLILAVGRLDKIKGFDLLISAMQKMPDGVFLEIAGEGPEREVLEQQIENLKLGDRVKLLGFRSDIRKLMADAQVVVISSHSEGFSLVLVEGFFYANLLLSTRVGGAGEVFPEELLYDHSQLVDKLKAVVKEYEKYRLSFTSAQSLHAEKFTLENMTKSYEKYYSNVLASQKDKEQ